MFSVELKCRKWSVVGLLQEGLLVFEVCSWSCVTQLFESPVFAMEGLARGSVLELGRAKRSFSFFLFNRRTVGRVGLRTGLHRFLYIFTSSRVKPWQGRAETCSFILLTQLASVVCRMFVARILANSGCFLLSWLQSLSHWLVPIYKSESLLEAFVKVFGGQLLVRLSLSDWLEDSTTFV